jgi:hypothetical protein
MKTEGITMKLLKCIATIALAASPFVASGEDAPKLPPATTPQELATQDLLELSFGMSFAMAEREKDPAEARKALNHFAFHYYLLCACKNAVLPSNPMIETGLAFQRTKRLTDADLLEDPMDARGSLPNLKRNKQLGMRAHTFESLEDYRATVSAFHRWLKELKYEPRKMEDAIKIDHPTIVVPDR